MEKFNDSVAKNKKVEMIHVSRDRDDDAAQDWAAAEKFPWLTVLPKNVERSGLMEYRQGNAVPSYSLVKADGEVVATGSSVFAKAKEL